MKGSRKNKIFSNLELCPPQKEKPTNKKFVDIEGKKFGKLTPLYYIGTIGKEKRSSWVCKCDCGNYVITNSHNLISNHTKSCGCLVSERLRENIIGKQFGYLKVLSYAESINENPYWNVICTKCGKEYKVSGDSLKHNHQISCGCSKSKGEYKLIDYFNKNQIQYTTQKTFDDCVWKNNNKCKYDFAIFNKNNNTFELIEIDGQQHYSPVKFIGQTIEDSYKNFIGCQCRDWYKDYYCIQNGISLSRIPYTIKNPTPEKLLELKKYITVNETKKINLFDVNTADFVNYKSCTYNILAGISCTFKCGKEFCINNPLINQEIVITTNDKLIKDYLNQSIATSITFQGLEALDNLKQILWFIYYFRKESNDNIILWTGYTKEECEDLIFLIKKMGWNNIIIKYGRYIPNRPSRYDEVLGINLVSDNQYAEVLC